ncbi:proprotein convertase subtilisin/kexin type 5-like [Mytilus edulis]|uniref:proprotein convertase subtilisin/kexin type 5-like n=1 Tax=Mytilus edulis TaxID=6550 RepID=UPI0039F12EB7
MKLIFKTLYLFSHVTVVFMMCLPSEVLIPDTKKCTEMCPSGTFIFDKQCVTTCPFRSKKLETGLARFCHFKNELSCQTSLCTDEYPNCYRMDCLKKCPEYTVEYNNTCLIKCPEKAPYLTFYDCDGICTRGNKSCSTLCPETHSYVFRSEFLMRCLKHCPWFTELISEKKSCKLYCPTLKPFLYNNTCYVTCPDTAPYSSIAKSEFNEIYLCVEKCPVHTVYDNRRCVESCPKGKYFFNNSCLLECPATHKYVYPKAKTLNTNFDFAEFVCVNDCSPKITYGTLCVDKCPPSAEFEFKGNCLTECPKDNPFIETNRGLRLKCVSRCKRLQFNQTCVTFCSGNAQYTFNGSCVSTCPNDHPLIDQSGLICVKTCKEKDILHKQNCYYICPTNAKYEFNGSCLASCPDKFPFMESTQRNVECVKSCKLLHYKNRCVGICPPEAKYKYNSSCVNECGDELPFHYDELVKKKSYNWPAWYTPIKYEHNYKCVTLCPTRTFQYNNSKCVLSCPLDQNFEFNGICYDQCPDTHLYTQQQGKHISCVNKCSTPLTYNSTCLKRCPKERQFELLGSCAEDCPKEKPFKELTSRKTYKCVDKCSTPLTYNSTCLKRCPKERQFELLGSCAEDCPKEKSFKELTSRKTYKCVDLCRSLEINDTCVDTCPPSAKFKYKWTCLEKCESDLPYAYYNTFVSPNMYHCLKKCFSGTFLYNNTECVPKCPKDAKFQMNITCASTCDIDRPYEFFDGLKWICLRTCPSNTYLFNSTSCLKSCPVETFKFKFGCIYSCPSSHPLNYTDTFGTYECVKDCPDQTFLLNGTCFQQCPGDMKGHVSKCLKECPESHHFIDEKLQTCLSKCPAHLVLKNDHVCSKECPRSAQFIENNKCVQRCNKYEAFNEDTAQGIMCHERCPIHLLLQETNNRCVKKCPYDARYIENHRCVPRCNKHEAVIEDTAKGKTCHETCPVHLLLQEMSNQCVKSCPSGLIVDSVCKQIRKCPYEKYIEHSKIGKRCTHRCSLNFFLDGTNCLKECPPEKVIAGAECLDICPPSYPFSYKEYTYRQSQVKCYKQCPDGHVVNGTTCISKYSCNNIIYDNRCNENCPTGTVQVSKHKCQSVTIYGVLAVTSVIIILLSVVCLSLIIFSNKILRNKCTLRGKKDRASTRADVSWRQLTQTDDLEATELKVLSENEDPVLPMIKEQTLATKI